MQIYKIINHELASQVTYILANKNNALLVDCGYRYGEIVNLLQKHQLNLKAILLTHGHYDHIYSLNKLCTNYKLQVYAANEAKELLYNQDHNLSSSLGANQGIIFKNNYLKVIDNQVLHINDWDITVISTPGHTKGSVCYWFTQQKIIFTGDTLFADTIGAYRFYNSNKMQLAISVKKLLKLDKEIVIYPGHGCSTTINKVKITNPYAIAILNNTFSCK